MYEEDLVTDEAINEWFEGEGKFQGGFSESYRKKLQPFIDWLNESEEESDED